jgi:hypothetical protein
LIGRRFVRNPFVPIAIDIKFDGFQFHHPLVRNVVNVDSGKVGIARKGTFTGKLRQFDANPIMPTGTGIRKRDQLPFTDQALTIGFRSHRHRK